MKHFLGFVVAIFLSLTIFYLYRDDGTGHLSDSMTLKVYGSSSFIGSWGPGPILKDLFEKQTGIKVTYLEMADPALVIQKISLEGKQASGDVILSLDQHDISKLVDKIKWKNIDSKAELKISNQLTGISKLDKFKPYDWAPIAFVTRVDNSVQVDSLDDLLKPELKGKIALEDPRTSSPGLNFLSWVFKVKSAIDAEKFLKDLIGQLHSISPSWSAAYGLFKNKQVDLVLSYATSPIYHLVEEKDSSYKSLEFKEGHPSQVEFAAVPDSCSNCEAGIKFVQFLQSQEAQRIIMEKNYMFPIERNVQEGTAFDSVKLFKLLPFQIDNKEAIQKWLSVWAELRKNDG